MLHEYTEKQTQHGMINDTIKIDITKNDIIGIYSIKRAYTKPLEKNLIYNDMINQDMTNMDTIKMDSIDENITRIDIMKNDMINSDLIKFDIISIDSIEMVYTS